MMKKLLLALAALAVVAMTVAADSDKLTVKTTTRQVGAYQEKRVLNVDESNFYKGRNKVQGVVLHHTACSSMQKALGALLSPGTGRSCHVAIDRDGTRYILADPETITKHAGYSYFMGREKVSEFTIGIEFQSVDTRVQPLTYEQIESAIDYLLPIIKKYHIRLSGITTHEQVRTAWLKRHPGSDVPEKVDIAEADYQRFMAALRKRMGR